MARVESEESSMARSSTSSGYRRNSAPAWKKIAIVLAAPVAMILVIRLLNADEWPQIVFFPVLIAVAVAAVWLMAKALGVRLSLGSWDEVRKG
jgi:hypothetical protein